ncbi:uncharacterized protein C8Q71DRAFT_414540 [Rhodofomes roseus]|uniref:Uncharacterized protein n=1 Tax=Rhodofomes roseus TaxID=34475 RepID=A0ABQ8KPQ0_9APHY|nr:uncharacterized protein C8Q71DRAFT_414540 [Rhodofomes roseus]KAH9840586.1 hypothetical protein C8Q71DRAFT_414540 [Rhodofomes roseus]
MTCLESLYRASCSAYRLAVAAACIGSALFLIYGVIAALRVYAITGRSYIVPSIIICLFLGGIIARIFYSLHLYAVPNLAESTQCVVASGLPSENVKRTNCLSRVLSCVLITPTQSRSS